MKKILSWALNLSGAALIVFGLQAWGFYRFVGPQIENADENLMALLEEVPAKSLVDETLSTLGEYRTATGRSKAGTDLSDSSARTTVRAVRAITR